MRNTSVVGLFCLVLFSCSTPPTTAPHAAEERTFPTELLARISQLDSAMFAAFNAHDADLLGTFFTSDLEFYHDKSGLASFDTTMADFRGLFARNMDTGLRRDLVPGSLEVYPLGDFGALEVCLHRFCHMANGTDDCGTFKNIMVWRKDDAEWKVSRVISYDH